MQKVTKKFSKFMLILVSALGLLSTTFLLSDPISPESELKSLFNLESTTLKNMRSIASIDPNLENDETVLNFDCESVRPTFEMANVRFRLKGPSCLTEGENTFLTTKIKNSTNGYIATVFHQGQDFTTDYINLKPGSNTIKLRFETGAKVVEKDLIVIRK